MVDHGVEEFRQVGRMDGFIGAHLARLKHSAE